MRAQGRSKWTVETLSGLDVMGVGIVPSMTAVRDARAEAMSELAAALLDALDERSLDQLAMALAPRLGMLVGESVSAAPWLDARRRRAAGALASHDLRTRAKPTDSPPQGRCAVAVSSRGARSLGPLRWRRVALNARGGEVGDGPGQRRGISLRSASRGRARSAPIPRA